MKTETTSRIVLVVLLVAGLGMSSLAAPATAARVGSFLYYHFDPPVIFNDGITSTTLEVATTNQGIAQVFVKGKGDYLQMYDDGTHGDRLAGDGIFTLSGITYEQVGASLNYGGTHGGRGFEVKIVKASGEEEVNWEPSLGIVDESQDFPAVKVGEGLYATEYAFFIVDPSGEVLPGIIPLSDVKCGKTQFAAYQNFYSVFPDVFDFLVVMPSGAIFDPARDYGENAPYFVAAKNSIQNIGLPIFDNTAQFGSGGRLMGTIFHSWGDGQILDHEIAHAWGALYGRSVGLTEETVQPSNTARYHWNSATDIGGQLGAYVFATGVEPGHLVANGDGTYRVVRAPGDKDLYSNLELYTMGLIPPGEVPPIHKLINPDYSNPQRVTAGGIETYTIEQLMQMEGGERIPSWHDAPKQFNIGFIAVSNKEFTPAECAWFSLVARYFASTQTGELDLTTFYGATGGRATLNASLAELAPNLNIPSGSPPPWAMPTLTPTATPEATPSPTPGTPALSPTSTTALTSTPAATPTANPQPTPTPVRPILPCLSGALPLVAIAFWLWRRLCIA